MGGYLVAFALGALAGTIFTGVMLSRIYDKQMDEMWADRRDLQDQLIEERKSK